MGHLEDRVPTRASAGAIIHQSLKRGSDRNQSKLCGVKGVPWLKVHVESTRQERYRESGIHMEDGFTSLHTISQTISSSDTYPNTNIQPLIDLLRSHCITLQVVSALASAKHYGRRDHQRIHVKVEGHLPQTEISSGSRSRTSSTSNKTQQRCSPQRYRRRVLLRLHLHIDGCARLPTLRDRCAVTITVSAK